MSGPIVRKYGIPNWDDIFGGKKQKGSEKSSPAKAKKTAAPAVKKAPAPAAKKVSKPAKAVKAPVKKSKKK